MILGLIEKPAKYIRSIAGAKAVTKTDIVFDLVKNAPNGDFISSREVTVKSETLVVIDSSNDSPKVATDDLYTFVLAFQCEAIEKGKDEQLSLRIHRTEVEKIFDEKFTLI